MAKTMLGIDIGTGFLKLAVVADGTRLVQVAYERMPENLMRNGRMVSFEAMADFLKETVQKHKITAKDCAILVNGNDAFVRRTMIPAMTVDQLELNLPYEFRDYLGEDQAKYRFDYAVLDTMYNEDGTPSQFDLLTVAAPIERIEQYENMLKRAGLRLKVATPEIMAYVKAVRMFEESGNLQGEVGDYCFADIGTTATKVHLFPQGKYDMTRSMEFGRKSLVDAVAERLDLTPAVADAYFEQNIDDAQNLTECQDLYERAAVELSRVVNFFNFNYRDSNLQQVHFTGTAANTASLMSAIQSRLSVNMVSAGAILPLELRPQTQYELDICFSAICVAAR